MSTARSERGAGPDGRMSAAGGGPAHGVRILLATRNRHKVVELVRLLARPGVVFEDLGAHPGAPEVDEDGATFEENAVTKARAIAAWSGAAALADDSGLEVDALGGAPGVRSARYAGSGANDAANRAALLAALAGVPDGARGARFRCVIALATPAGEVHRAVGSCAGRIGREERGMSGFGYDALFFPEGETRTFAELSEAEKDARSHRAAAARAASRFIEELVHAEEARRAS